jgi:hypothetical protein
MSARRDRSERLLCASARLLLPFNSGRERLLVNCIVANSWLSGWQQHPLFEMPCRVGVGGGVRIMRHHHDRLMEVFVQAL